MKSPYLFEEITDKILKCAVEVHKTLGPGFLESLYENALVLEMKKTGLKVEQQKPITVRYKGNDIGEHRLDLLVEDSVVVELKTVKTIDDTHRAQVLSQLKAAKIRLGLILNFAKTKIEIKRIIL